MYKKTLLSLAIASSITLTGCLDDGETKANASPEYKITNPLTDGKTYARFNAATGDLPIPNDILFAKQIPVDGTMSAYSGPSNTATAADLANPVVVGVDYLDGNSVLAQFDIPFSDSLDPNQTLDAASYVDVGGGTVIPNPNQNVFLLPLRYPGTDALSQAKVNGTAVEVPTFAEAVSYQTAAALKDATTLAKLATPVARAEIISLDGGTNNVLRISPLTPLNPETKYLIIVTNKIKDRNGDPVAASDQYQNMRLNGPVASSALAPVQAAVLQWETLAAGYFAFMQKVYDGAGLTSFKAPAKTDIVFTMTFTTGGTDSVLKHIAAPGTFFQKSLAIGYRQDAISKLVAGTYNLNKSNSALTSATDVAINTTINTLLTSQVLSSGAPNSLYNATIAGAITAGAATKYSDLSSDATAAFILQSAAAEAAYAIHNSGSTASGDKDSYTIAQEGAGAALQFHSGILAKGGSGLPMPKSRTTKFYSMAAASTINKALTAPAVVSQGEITLPYYLKSPENEGDGSNIRTSKWEADKIIGSAIDTAKGNAAGTTPPSSMVTYRYPFPAKQSDKTVPLLAVAPAVQNYGTVNVSKPSGGWPVVIYQHGITTDRSAVLPMANALAFACVNTNSSSNPANWAASGLPCFATVAIDQPLHGVSPAGSTVPGLTSVSHPTSKPTGNIGTPSATLTERHFNFTADASLAATPMSYTSGAEVGKSGSLFINMTNFANSRDNLRQMAVDLMNLNASLATMDIDGDGVVPDLDVSKVYFIGHSLGGVDGIPYVAVNNDSSVATSNATISAISGGAMKSPLNKIVAASLLNTGGGIMKLLENSPNTSFGAAAILPGLSAASNGVLVQGTSSLEKYFSVFQGLLDSGDAMTFASKLSDKNTGILLTEIVGSTETGKAAEDTIPNGADTKWGANNGPLSMVTSTGFTIKSLPAPLGGTEPLVDQFKATKTASATAGPKGVAVTRFVEGQHGTPVSAGSREGDSSAVFLEMVKQTAILFGFDGAAVSISNTAIVEK